MDFAIDLRLVLGRFGGAKLGLCWVPQAWGPLQALQGTSRASPGPHEPPQGMPRTLPGVSKATLGPPGPSPRASQASPGPPRGLPGASPGHDFGIDFEENFHEFGHPRGKPNIPEIQPLDHPGIRFFYLSRTTQDPFWIHLSSLWIPINTQISTLSGSHSEMISKILSTVDGLRKSSSSVMRTTLHPREACVFLPKREFFPQQISINSLW